MISVELDAMPAQALRDLVQGVIEQHLPAAKLEHLRRVEREERRLLHGLVGMVADP